MQTPTKRLNEMCSKLNDAQTLYLKRVFNLDAIVTSYSVIVNVQ